MLRSAALLGVLIFPCLAAADDFVPFVIPGEVNPKSAIALPPMPAIKPNGERLVVKGDKFYVGQERFKVWGVNLCFAANFPKHEDARRVAARLAASGVNSVRFHHMDSANYSSGIWDGKEKNKFHPEALERLDYFIDQLAQHGIYANINLHVGRAHSKTLGLHAGVETHDKMIDLFTPELIEMQKQYARELLGHVNQYRKVRYADDAAVGFVEINNENSLFMWSAPEKLPTLPDFYAKILQTKFNAWLKQQFGTTEKIKAAWGKEAVPLGENLLVKDLARATGGKPGWNLEQHSGCAAALKPLNSGKLVGVRIEISKADNETWHIQFNHSGLPVTAAKPYSVSFKARADAARSITYSVGMAHDPWGPLGLHGNANLTTDWKTFHVGFTPTADDKNARLNFQLSGNPAAVEIADVVFQEGGGQGLVEGESLETGTIAVFPTTEPKLRMIDRMKFMAELERAYYSGMRDFLRQELGVKAPITGTIVFGPLGMWAQQDMDFIDAHAYWKHPHFPRRPWDPNDWIVEQKAMVDSAERSTLPTLAASRLAGKPYTVSEYNHPAPNDYQAECVPLLAAFGGAQDWDGVWFFAYSHNQDWDKPSFDSFFDMRSNPAKWGFMLPGGILFKRSYQSERRTFVLDKTGDRADLALLQAKYHLNMAGAAGVKLRDIFGASAQPINVSLTPVATRSNTPPEDIEMRCGMDELLRSNEETLREILPKPKALAGWLANDDDSAGKCFAGANYLAEFVCATGPEKKATNSQHPAFAMGVSLDGQNIFRTKSYLIAICGRCENTDMKFSADRRTVGTNWGHGPVRIEAITVEIPTPRHIRKQPAKLFALGPDGVPTGEVPLIKGDKNKNSSDHWEIGPKYGTMWYWLRWED